MITIKDVAKTAGVSTATVSRVLSGRGPCTVDTKQKVFEAVEKLKYQPNGIGRSLRKQQTCTVIAVFPDITNPFFAQIIRGMEDEAHVHGFQLILGNTDNSQSRSDNYIKLLSERRADGIIWATARISKEELQHVQQIAPLVLACEYMQEGMYASISIDNEKAAYEATSHLIRLGHRHIVHMAGPMEISIIRDRLHGYMKAMKDHGLQAISISEGEFSISAGRRMITQLLQKSSYPTAVFAASDTIAIGAVLQAKEQGLRLPDDLAVVGFDDIEMAQVVDPPLTTVWQPQYEIGVESMRKLILMLQGKEDSNIHQILPHRLQIRKSCGSNTVLTRR